MNFWQVLGLEPSADTKAIKLAYAKLLKKTRPDDDPEGFQKLREAYEAALSASEVPKNALLHNYFDSDLHQSGITITDKPSEGVSEAETTNDRTHAKNSDAGLDSEWSEFISGVETLIASPDMVNIRHGWRKLLDSPMLVDLQYRKRASERVFCMVADSCLAPDRKSEEMIGADLVKFLNDEFQWEPQKYDLLIRFGQKRTNAVFEKLDELSIDKTFRYVGWAGSVLGICVIACGYYGVLFWAVVFLAAVLSTARRLYVRQWQIARQGYTNGGDAGFLKENKVAEVFFIFMSMCITEALFYGLGRGLRIVIG